MQKAHDREERTRHIGWTVKIAAVLLPLAIVALAELVLRWADAGYNLALFVPHARDPKYVVFNPDLSKRYFTNTANATVGNSEMFCPDKPAGTYRIFVLGESTTLGYPYLHNGSFARMLQHRLRLTFPHREIEMINLSLTAVNSYAVADIASELHHYGADAVLLYVGHNEYYGALGVSSSSAWTSNRTLTKVFMAMRHLKIVQVFTNLFSAGVSASTDQSTTLMQRMSEKHAVSLGSDAFDKGVAQFEANITEALSSLQAHGIRVFISTVVSNEKDQPPLLSIDEEPRLSAAAHFSRGQQFYDKGQFDSARTAFAAAKELDALRFRAPAALNHIIVRCAGRFKNVSVVDTDQQFRQHSPNGIPGAELFLEHVHPNLRGYALMADAFYEAMRKSDVIEKNWTSAVTADSLAAVMPLTKIDTLKGLYEIMMLLEQWPFYRTMPPPSKGPKSMEENIAGAIAVKQMSWGEGMRRALDHYRKVEQPLLASKTMEALVLDNPHHPAVAIAAANLAQDTGNNALAIFYLEQAFRWQPDFSTARKLFVALLQADQPEDAIPYIKFAIGNSPPGLDLRELLALVEAIVDTKKALRANARNEDALIRVARLYLRFANAKAAEKYVRASLSYNAMNAEALALRNEVDALKATTRNTQK